LVIGGNHSLHFAGSCAPFIGNQLAGCAFVICGGTVGAFDSRGAPMTRKRCKAGCVVHSGTNNPTETTGTQNGCTAPYEIAKDRSIRGVLGRRLSEFP
jgi:hypothetical protein